MGGSSGQVVIVQRSTDLTEWTGLETNKMTATPVYFGDYQSGAYTARWYRLLAR
jgi:hypothetical protein